MRRWAPRSSRMTRMSRSRVAGWRVMVYWPGRRPDRSRLVRVLGPYRSQKEAVAEIKRLGLHHECGFDFIPVMGGKRDG